MFFLNFSKTKNKKTRDAKPQHRVQGEETTSHIEFSKTSLCVDLHYIHHGVLSEKTMVHVQTRDREGSGFGFEESGSGRYGISRDIRVGTDIFVTSW